MDEKLFRQKIDQRATQMIRAQKTRNKGGVWFGLGMMGLVGWSVVVPTLLGASAGIWIDGHAHGNPPSTYSWTLMLLIIGLLTGCLNAWRWVAKEQREMQEDADA